MHRHSFPDLSKKSTLATQQHLGSITFPPRAGAMRSTSQTSRISLRLHPPHSLTTSQRLIHENVFLARLDTKTLIGVKGCTVSEPVQYGWCEFVEGLPSGNFYELPLKLQDKIKNTNVTNSTACSTSEYVFCSKLVNKSNNQRQRRGGVAATYTRAGLAEPCLIFWRVPHSGAIAHFDSYS